MVRLQSIRALVRKEIFIRMTSPATIFGQIVAPLAVIVLAFIIHMTTKPSRPSIKYFTTERPLLMYVDVNRELLSYMQVEFENFLSNQTCMTLPIVLSDVSLEMHDQRVSQSTQNDLMDIIAQRKFYVFTQKLYEHTEDILGGFVGVIVNRSKTEQEQNTTLYEQSMRFEYNLEKTSEERKNHHLFAAHRLLLITLYLKFIKDTRTSPEPQAPFMNLMTHAVPMSKSLRHTVTTWAIVVSVSATISLMVMCYRILEEKSSKVQHLMKLAGVSMFEYHASFFVVDFALLLVIVLVSIGTFGFFGILNWFSYTIFVLVHTITSLALVFVVTTVVQGPNNGCVLYLILNSVTFATPFLLSKEKRAFEFTNFNGNMWIPDWLHYILCMILPPYYALEMAFSLMEETRIIRSENQGDNSTVKPWQFFTATTHHTILTPGTVLIAMFLSCFLWFGVVYLIHLNPWRAFRRNATASVTLKNLAKSAVGQESHFQRVSEGFKEGISVVSVTKRYSDAGLVLKGVSWKVYYGQVTVLLGHNGAGKTTLINIITGMAGQSSGSVSINGYDKDTHPHLARKDIALCPQHNILFDSLTVWDHLELFGRLKGLKAPAVFHEVVRVAELVNLVDKSETAAKNLSGGMKRRLQIAMAVMGGSKIIILDEPSSGLDIESRRSIWKLLLSMKEDFLILLTTHYMEEADFLSDRIAIMYEGMINCCGSSMFLKKAFNVNYHIKVAKMTGFDAQSFLKFSRDHLKSTQLVKQNTTEAWYSFSSQEKCHLANFFAQLEVDEMKLHVKSCGIAGPTLEDVFVKVQTSLAGPSSTNLLAKIPKTKSTSLCTQIKALMAKDFHVLKRSRSILFLFVYIQAISLVLLTSVIRINVFQTSSDIFDYNNVQGATARCVGVKDYCDVFTRNFETMGLEQNKDADNTMFTVEIVEKDTQICVHVNTTQEVDIKLLTVTFDGLVKLWGKLTNQSFGDLTFSVIPKQIVHLKPYFAGTKMAAASFQSHLIFLISLFISLAFYVTPIRLVLQEKISKVRLLQEMTGVTQFSYWTSKMLCCIFVTLFLCLPFVFTVCFAFLFETSIFFDTLGSSALFFITLLLTSIASPVYAYLGTYLFTSQIGGLFTILTITTMASIMTYGLLLLRFSFVFVLIMSHSPSFAFSFTLSKLAEHFLDRYICSYIFSHYPDTCKPLDSLNQIDCSPRFPGRMFDFAAKLENPLMSSQCCNSSTVKACDKVKHFFYEKCCNEGLPKENTFWHLVLLLWPMLLCVLFSAVFTLFSIRAKRGSFGQNVMSNQLGQLQTNKKEDLDVHNLRSITEKLIANKEQMSKAFSVKNLTKVFKNKLVVERLTFYIEKSTCFGLLGVNGAGKTTALRILVGDLSPSMGEAYAAEWSASNSFKRYRTKMGYCPQFNSFVDKMTGEEMLYLFAKLRGIASTELKATVENVIRFVKLEQYAKRLADNYSGGNKRKLAVAIAMIGFPDLIFLDEPSTAIDPIARRQIWSAVDNAKTSANSSIILTSHCMEEVEALCDAIVIMAGGSFKCYGSSQYLAKKFGQGYLITFKFDEKVNDKVVQQLEQVVEKHLPDAQPVESYKAVAQFHVPLKSYTKSVLYKGMEAIRNAWGSGDYDINETSLEDIFLRFARLEYKGEEEVSVDSVPLGIKE